VRLAALLAWAIVAGGAPLLLGPPGGDDAYYHAMRAQQHARCWRAGVPWPRWYPDLNGGLGGPEPRAYPAAALAGHAVLALALDDAVAATSLSTLLVPIVAAVAMLAALRRRSVAPASATAVAAVWAAAPYLLITLHPRAALAEAWGLALLPLVLEALLPPAPADRRQAVRAAAWLALLVATHLLVAFMAIVIVGVAQLLRLRGRTLRWALTGGITGLLLAGASWLPSVAALPRLASDVLVAGDLSWDRHLLPGGVANDPALGHHLTLVLLAVTVAALAVALFGGGAARPPALAAIAVLALATPIAAPLYRLVPGFALLQFPWRWLGPATCLVLLACAVAARPAVRAVALLLVVAPLAVAPVWRWRLPDGPPLRPSDEAAAAAEAAQRYGVPPILPSAPNFLPRGVSLADALVAARPLRAELPPARPAGPARWEYLVTRAAAGEQPVPLLDGPGWQARVDGAEVGWNGARSLVAVPVPAGSHRVELRQVLLVEDVLGLLLSAAGVAWVASLWRRRAV
jgi:uncharacterized membrane protein